MPENLTPWTDPELEARVVALVLGEASDFERDQLRELISGNVELAAFQKRMEAIHGLLLESCGRQSENAEEGVAAWQLPNPQRQPLLNVLSTASAPKSSPAPKRRPSLFVRPAFWWSAAACFVLLAVAVFLTQAIGPAGRSRFDTFVKAEVKNGRGDWGFAAPEPNAVAPSTPSAPPPPPAEEPAAAAAPAQPAGSAGTGLAFSSSGAASNSGTIGAFSGNVSMAGGNEVIVSLQRHKLSAGTTYKSQDEVSDAKPAASPAPAAAPPQAQLFGRPLNRSAGDATLDLNGGSTYTGGTTVTAGTAIGSGGIVKSGAGTLTINGGVAVTAGGAVSNQPAAAPVQLRIDGNDKTKDKVIRSNELAIVPRSGADIYSYSSAPSPLAGKSETTALPELGGKDIGGFISEGGMRGDKKPASSVPEAAKKAVARRQESVAKADEAALRGGRMLATRDYEGAVNELKKSVDLVPDAPVVESRKKEYSDQLANAKVALAKQRAEEGRYGEASSLVASVAQEKPSSEAGKKAQQLLKDLNDPDIYSPAVTPEHIAKIKQIELAQKTAEGHARIGDYDGAQKNYEKVLAQDPYNSAARKGLQEVERQRRQYSDTAYDHTRAKFLNEVAKNWETEVPKFEAKGEEEIAAAAGTAKYSGKDHINEKLKCLIIPEIEFDNTPLDAALDFLRQKSRELDDLEPNPARKGVNIVLRGTPSSKPGEQKAGAAPASGEASKMPPITLKLSNVPLVEALRYTTEQANLKFKAYPHALVVEPAGEAGGELYTQVVRVPPNFLTSEPDSSAGDSWKDLNEPRKNQPATQQPRTARDILESVGVTFPPGSSATYDPTTSQLVIRNTQSNLDLVGAYVEAEGETTPETEKHPVVETAQPQPRPEPEPIAETSASTEPFSTFSLHVSDVSYKLAKASLAEGKWPDPSRIRIEEFVNAFDYGDPSPAGSEPVACALEQSIHPFQQARNLLRISLRTAAAGRGSSTPLRLTLLLDSSGSMERADRRETLQAAITQLAGQLKANDRVTLVTFARQPRLQADQLPGDQSKTLSQIIANTPSEGGTNLEAALKLAVEKAKEHFQANAQNRIVLLTDGAANLGDANPERLSQAVEAMRRQGIAFDTAGIGADGLNDTVLEALSRKGDGRYYLLDSPDDAGENFAAQLAGAFRPAAKNVKVQVWFNPDRVRHYRLLGFEEHRLQKEDFRNDSVDAAELAAAEAGVAMYQFEPLPEGIGDIGYVSVRFQDVGSGQMVERRWPVPYEANPSPFEKASAGIRLAASAAFLAAKLGDDPLASLIDLSVLDRAAANEDLRTLIHQTRNLSTTR